MVIFPDQPRGRLWCVLRAIVQLSIKLCDVVRCFDLHPYAMIEENGQIEVECALVVECGEGNKARTGGLGGSTELIEKAHHRGLCLAVHEDAHQHSMWRGNIRVIARNTPCRPDVP